MTATLLFSCKNTNKNTEPLPEKPELVFPVTIDVEGAMLNEENLLLSNFSDDVSYIKLKTPQNIIIRRVNDVQIFGNKIYFEETLSETIMVFDMNGNFIKQIGKVGRGPGEYIYLRSFCFDEVSGDLLLYTGPSGTVKRYDPEGEFIEDIFNVPFDDYMYANDSLLIFSGFLCTVVRNMPENIFQFLTTTKKGQKIDSVPLPIYSVNNWRETVPGFSGNYGATKFDNYLLLHGLSEDTIFHVSGTGEIEARYFLDFGRYNFPFESRYLRNAVAELPNYITALSPPFETQNNLWIKFSLHKGAFILNYDKLKRESFVFNYKGENEIDFASGKNTMDDLRIINDIDGGPDFFPQWSVYNDSTQLFIAALDAFELKTEVTPEYVGNKEAKYPEKKAQVIELLDNIGEKDDYILMVVKLK